MSTGVPLPLHLPPVFTAPDGTRWRRLGACSRCGQCCAGDPFNGTLGPPPVAGMCALFRWLPDGRGACGDTTGVLWRQGCGIWPTEPAHLTDHPYCTYRFERVP